MDYSTVYHYLTSVLLPFFISQYKTYKIIDSNSMTLPFVFNDVMGLENCEADGIDPNDIIEALHGHVKEGYKVGENVELLG